MPARRSRIEVYLHLVWATKGRADTLHPEAERIPYRCITQEAERLRCGVLAIGGMPNHVHVVVYTAGSISPAQLVKQMKGVSSALLSARPELNLESFAWQDGYACFSISRPHLAVVIAYVKNQKHHHGACKIWSQWEETDQAMHITK